MVGNGTRGGVRGGCGRFEMYHHGATEFKKEGE